jgi:glycosyltransferase involved in cell wall biosynthesis
MVVIPAYREARTIAAIVREARAATGWPVVVVDDASDDDTGPLAAAAGARVLSLVNNLGAWGATQTGIRLALWSQAELVVTMDADGQHQAAAIAALIAPVLAGQCDVGIGANPPRVSAARQLAWRFFRALTGLKVEDLTSGFRCYNQRAMAVLASRDATLLDYQDVGVLTLLRTAGLRFQEVPVDMQPRSYGASRVFSSWLRVGHYLSMTLLLCVSKWEHRWLTERRQRPRNPA